MLISARHITRYRYSRSVWFQPLTVRLRPRTDFRQRLLEFALEMDPQPAGMCDSNDLEGNQIMTAWFSEPADFLTVTTSFRAQTQSVDPFQFLLRSDATRLPLVPPASEESHFALYAQPRASSAEVSALARQIAKEADYETINFVCRLNTWIHEHHQKVNRVGGGPRLPSETLQLGSGACRDLTVLFIEACRAMNIPSRFVSGYAVNSDPVNSDAVNADETTERELHAWAEVYLPGGGWRGFDPSIGLAIADHHVAVATGVNPDLAAPTSGTFSGDAHSSLENAIEIHATYESQAGLCGHAGDFASPGDI